jgi:hypothetical protein
VPENFGLSPEIVAAAELPVPTSLKEHVDFTQEGPSSSSQLLAETEMAEIEGRGLFLIGLAAAKVAIMVTPKILPFAVRVIINPKTQDTILQTKNTGRHLVQIGVDRWGRHVGFGANKMNPATARWHIYQNNPWRIYPR